MLVDDLIAIVLNKLSLPELHAWAQLSNDNFEMVRHELRTRHRRMLLRFFTNPTGIMELLQARSSVISGSFALNYFTGETKWSPGDVDIYVPLEEFTEVRDYLIKVEGYRENPEDKIRYERRLARHRRRQIREMLKSTAPSRRAPTPTAPTQAASDLVVATVPSGDRVLGMTEISVQHVNVLPDPIVTGDLDTGDDQSEDNVGDEDIDAHSDSDSDDSDLDDAEEMEFYDPPCLESGIAQVARLFKDGKKVDVIQNKSHSALFALTRFWSTLQMSFLSGTGFCCPYPNWTRHGIGLLSPLVLDADGQPRLYLDRVLTKYEDRGYVFFRTARKNTVRCLHAPGVCIATQRSFEDRHCYTLRFDEEDAPYVVGEPIVVSALHKTSWRFGGWHNQDGYVDQRSRTFNAITGEAETKTRFDRRA